MSGQQPWQGPDGRRYSSGQGSLSGTPSWRPGQQEPPRKERPEKESRLVAFREWLSTGAGVATLIVTIVGLLIGGVAAGGKIFSPTPDPTHSVTPGGHSPTASPSPSPSSPSPPPASLTSTLLPSGILGSAAMVESTSTDLSQIDGICGGSVSGDTSTASEMIQNDQTGTLFYETLVTWDNTNDADQSITDDRQAVDQNEGCSTVSPSGITQKYSGDEQGSPPQDCVDSGQYFATQATASSPSFFSLYFGFFVEARCGTTTITITIENDLPGGKTQQTADGYLSQAIGKLK